MPSQAHAGAAQEAPDIGQSEGQDVPLVRPSSCTVQGGIPSSRRYLPTYLGVQGVSTFSDTTASVSQSTSAVVINGGVRIAGDVYCSNTFNLSDKRLKENITPLPNAPERIDKLGGYTFTCNNDAGFNLSGRSAIHCIAQVVDEAILGNLATNRIPHLAVEYTRLVPYLIQSVKTLKGKRDNLQQELIAVKRMKRY